MPLTVLMSTPFWRARVAEVVEADVGQARPVQHPVEHMQDAVRALGVLDDCFQLLFDLGPGLAQDVFIDGLAGVRVAARRVAALLALKKISLDFFHI